MLLFSSSEREVSAEAYILKHFQARGVLSALDSGHVSLHYQNIFSPV